MKQLEGMLSPFGELKDCVVIVEKMTQKSKVGLGFRVAHLHRSGFRIMTVGKYHTHLLPCLTTYSLAPSLRNAFHVKASWVVPQLMCCVLPPVLLKNLCADMLCDMCVLIYMPCCFMTCVMWQAWRCLLCGKPAMC